VPGVAFAVGDPARVEVIGLISTALVASQQLDAELVSFPAARSRGTGEEGLIEGDQVEPIALFYSITPEVSIMRDWCSSGELNSA